MSVVDRMGLAGRHGEILSWTVSRFIRIALPLLGSERHRAPIDSLPFMPHERAEAVNHDPRPDCGRLTTTTSR